MRGFALWLIAYVFTGLLGSLTHQLGATAFVPDVTVAFVVYAVLNLGSFPAALTVAAIGLMEDGFAGGGLIGLHTETLLLVFLLLQAFLKRWRATTSFGVILAAEVGLLLHDLIFLVLALLFDSEFRGAALVVQAIVPRMIVTLPLIPIVLSLVRRIDQRLFRPPSRIFSDGMR
jgi:rod shape-determining protein MreD